MYLYLKALPVILTDKLNLILKIKRFFLWKFQNEGLSFKHQLEAKE